MQDVHFGVAEFGKVTLQQHIHEDAVLRRTGFDDRTAPAARQQGLIGRHVKLAFRVGFAMAAAPAITQFVGGTPDMALKTTLEMYEITFSEHPGFTIPALNFRGTPLGIDVRYVMESGILPQINTGIAHKDPGVGMVGAGILRAPEKCFQDAFEMLCVM